MWLLILLFSRSVNIKESSNRLKAEPFNFIERIRAMELERTLGVSVWVFLADSVNFLIAGRNSGRHTMMMPSRGSSVVKM